MKKFITLLLILSLTSCLSWYRHYSSGSINDKLNTNGYYSSEKKFTIFDKSTASYAYLRFLDTENKRLAFSHSKKPISPDGKVIQGSRFKTSYRLNYNSDTDSAILTFGKTVSSFASYTGKLHMTINIEVSENGYLKGYVFHPDKISKEKTTEKTIKKSARKNKK